MPALPTLLRVVLITTVLLGAVDAGAHMISAMAFWQATAPGDVMISNGLATMGFAVPAAIAAALEDPVRGAVAITGDGGFMMNSQELETAVRLELNLTVLILNDSSYGMIRWKQANMGLKDWGLEYNNPDFVK